MSGSTGPVKPADYRSDAGEVPGEHAHMIAAHVVVIGPEDHGTPLQDGQHVSIRTGGGAGHGRERMEAMPSQGVAGLLSLDKDDLRLRTPERDVLGAIERQLA